MSSRNLHPPTDSALFHGYSSIRTHYAMEYDPMEPVVSSSTNLPRTLKDRTTSPIGTLTDSERYSQDPMSSATPLCTVTELIRTTGE